MSSLNFTTTLIAQAKSTIDATISVQDVIDIDVDYTSSIKCPLDLFNNLIYFSSDQNIDGDESAGGADKVPDLEIAMDSYFFDKYLELEYDGETQSSETKIYFKPPFGTIPFSQSTMVTGQINPPPGDQQASESQDDLAGKHLGIWICKQLFGETGFGIVSNFQHLIKDTINLNSALNESTVRMVKQNGGFLPDADQNRNTGANSNGLTYLTPVSEGVDPREAIAATSFQGPDSNNIGYQIINSGLKESGTLDNNNEMFNRLVRAVRKVTEPKRIQAALSENLNPNDNNGPYYDTIKHIAEEKQRMQYGDVLLPFFTIDVKKNHFVSYGPSTDPSKSSEYFGELTLTEDMKSQVENHYGLRPNVVTVPEVVLNAWVNVQLELHEFCLLNEFVTNDTVYMLTAVASENSAVLQTGALGGAITENSFQPDIINRVSYASKSIYFNNQCNPKSKQQDYMSINPDGVGGLYDESVDVNLSGPGAKLLGWRVGGHTLKLTDTLKQLQVKYLAAWAYVVATAQYCQKKKLKDGIGMGPDGGNAPDADAVKLLNPVNWRIPDLPDDEKLKRVAQKYISAESAAIYQSWFDRITSEQNPVIITGSNAKEQIKNFAQSTSEYSQYFHDKLGNVRSIDELVKDALKGYGEDSSNHALNIYLRLDDGSGASVSQLAVHGLGFTQ